MLTVGGADLDRRVLGALPEAVVAVERDGTIRGAWGGCFEIFGEPREALVGTTAFARVHPDDSAFAAGALDEAITVAGGHIPINVRVRTTSGEWVLTEVAAGDLADLGLLVLSVRPLAYRGYLEERRADLQVRCLGLASDVAAAHGAKLERAIHAAVRSIGEFFHASAAQFCVPGMCTSVGETDVAWPAQTDLSAGGWRRHDERVGYTILEVDVPADGDARWWFAWRDREFGDAGWDGSHLEDLRLAGAVTAAACARLQLETDLVRRSREDGLTGLVNRATFHRRLRRLVASGSVTVLFCDLDGFKAVNDGHGHAFGDRVLEVVARRLSGAVRPGDVVGRLGGDEFVVACPAISPSECRRIVAQLRAATTGPIWVDGIEIHVGISIGTARGDRGADPAAVLAAADADMYADKARRRRH